MVSGTLDLNSWSGGRASAAGAVSSVGAAPAPGAPSTADSGSCSGSGGRRAERPLRRRQRAALRADPRLELRPRHRLDRDRHVAVARAAQLRALAVIDAGLVDRQRPLVEAAGHRVDLEPQRAARANAWITSAPVTWMRSGSPTGTTMRLSTARCDGSPRGCAPLPRAACSRSPRTRRCRDRCSPSTTGSRSTLIVSASFGRAVELRAPAA